MALGVDRILIKGHKEVHFLIIWGSPKVGGHVNCDSLGEYQGALNEEMEVVTYSRYSTRMALIYPYDWLLFQVGGPLFGKGSAVPNSKMLLSQEIGRAHV